MILPTPFAVTLTTRAFDQGRLRLFEASACTATPRGPPSFLAQHCSRFDSCFHFSSCAFVAHGESPAGISPTGARRTVLESLDSYGSHHATGDLRPNVQCANRWGSRRAICPNQCIALVWCPLSRLYFRFAQSTRSFSSWRRMGYNADR